MVSFFSLIFFLSLHTPSTWSNTQGEINKNYNLIGSTWVVAGGGSGIGRATCLQLARDGARVVVTDINMEAASETLGLIPSKSQHYPLPDTK